MLKGGGNNPSTLEMESTSRYCRIGLATLPSKACWFIEQLPEPLGASLNESRKEEL